MRNTYLAVMRRVRALRLPRIVAAYAVAIGLFVRGVIGNTCLTVMRRVRALQLPRIVVAYAVAIGLFVLGVIDVALLVAENGTDAALFVVFNEPGKFVFHLLLLPLSALLLIAHYPPSLSRNRSHLWLLLVLAAFGACYGIFDHRSLRLERLPNPVDLPHAPERVAALACFEQLAKGLQKDASTDCNSSRCNQTLLDAGTAILDGGTTDVRTEPEPSKLLCEDLSECTADEQPPRASLRAQCAYRSFLNGLHPTDTCGLRCEWAGLLTAVGTAFGALLAGVIVSFTFTNQPNEELLEGVVTLEIVVLLMVTWLPLRAYTEWHLALHSFSRRANEVIGVAGTIAFVMSVLLLAKVQLKAGLLTLVALAFAGAVSLLADAESSWMTAAFSSFAKWHDLSKLTLYILLALFWTALVQRVRTRTRETDLSAGPSE